jgi:hypothetical protein
MGAKAEVGWTTPGEDGLKRHVFAQRVGGEWHFFERPRRKGKEVQWEPLAEPPLEDWLELLDCVERRSGRGLHPPREAQRIRSTILERFPDHRFIN